MTTLTEIDSLEILVIIDNELDPISTYQLPPTTLTATGNLMHIAHANPIPPTSLGPTTTSLLMSNIPCAAHGLSLMITATVGPHSRTLLFDTGPEPSAFALNASRLRADLSQIELIHLSHWHRDHSGGMLKAIELINAARGPDEAPVRVDLHPSRPEFRGFMSPKGPVSMEADPTFDEIMLAGGEVVKKDTPHTVLGGMFMISGEIPRVTPYEKGVLRGIRWHSASQSWESDELIRDERLLMCNVKGKGVVVFTGCSHAGAVNACKHAVELAEKAAGEKVPLYAVMGGYHLVGPNEAMVEETVRDFKELDAKVYLPGHCSGWRVKYAIEREMPGRLAPSTVGTRFVI